MNLKNIVRSFLMAIPFAATGVLSQTSPQPPTGGTETSSARATAQSNDAPSPIAPGTIIAAELSKSIDAKKAKPGDKIEARTTMDLLAHGQIVIPRDTKVIGHVTEAKPRSKESPGSTVGIAFDDISLKDGRNLSLQASVQAIGRPLNELRAPGNEAVGATAGMPGAGAPGAPGTMGGLPRPGSPSYPASNTPEQPSGTAPSGGTVGTALDPHSHGVVGISGLSLSSSGQNSVISSASSNVHLESGTQLILRTE